MDLTSRLEFLGGLSKIFLKFTKNAALFAFAAFVPALVLVLGEPGALLAATGPDIAACKEAVAKLRASGPPGLPLASALARLGFAAEAIEDLPTAEAALNECLEISRKYPGKNNSNLIVALIYMSDLRRHQGRYNAAYDLSSQARRMAQARVVAESNSKESVDDLAICLNKLSLVEDGAGRYKRGEELARQSMELYKQIRAADDPVVASASIALADNLRQQGKYKEALPILVSAQGSLTKCKDKRYAHSAATATNNLGAIYFWLGDYAKAEPLIESAYQMRRLVVSGNSDEIANSLGDLAAIYHKTGRYDKAESALHEALAIRQKSVGRAHRETALLLGNLGNLYAAQGKNDEAVKYYNQALDVLKKAGLSQHPESGEYLEGLGLTLAKEKQFDEALKLLRQSLTIRKKAFGLSNPDTAKSMVAIGKVLKWQQDALPEGRRDYREAGRYLRDGAARLKETLGADHPDYLSVGKFEIGDLAGAESK